MGREGEWTPTPPPSGRAGPAQNMTSGISGPPQDSGFGRPPVQNPGISASFGPPVGNNGVPQRTLGNPPQGQPVVVGPSTTTQGQLRAPLTGGPLISFRPLSANSTTGMPAPGESSSGGPPGVFGSQYPGALTGPPPKSGDLSALPPSTVRWGPPTGFAGVAPPSAPTNYSRLASVLPSPPSASQVVSSQPGQFPPIHPPHVTTTPGPFLGNPATGPTPSPGPGQAPTWGSRGPPSGPSSIRHIGPPPSSSTAPVAPFPRGSMPLPSRSQIANLGAQGQSTHSPAFGPPGGDAVRSGGAPPFISQAAPPKAPQRVFPDAVGAGAPSFGMATPQGPEVPQHYPLVPSHHPTGMGHLPGVADKYGPGIPGMSKPPPSATQHVQSDASRIDPNQIPRPLPGAGFVEFETRVNGQANLPPSATTSFLVRDTGNCSPRYMRCTLNQIPCSGDLLGTSSMPLAVLVQPFALPHPSEEPIPVVDFGESGPVRCARCKAYVNYFMKFVDQGRYFVCNLCGFSNETPRDYHCNLGPDGQRRDARQRPELSKGTVEFVASKEYLVRPPMPAVYFFLIDVSSVAVQTGAVAASCSAINRTLADLPEGPRTMVGIATFDSTIHYYSLNKGLQQAAMLVVPDIQDVYIPLQTDLIVPLTEAREHLQQLLESIPSMSQKNRVPESAFGAAIKGAFLAMKATGGKLLVFQSVLPSVGVGALTPRESQGRVGGEKEYLKLLQYSDKVLKEMAIELAEFQVCVDLFIMSQQYMDIASLSVVPRTTGGQVYYYHPFYAGADSAKLYNDLRWNVTRPQGLEAVMRVRCSQGLQVQEYFGNFCKRIPTDVDLPAIDCDKTIMITFKHDDKFQDAAECCFQCALLYTTVMGERRIRVITLSLSCTTVLSNLFRGADLDAQFTYILKHAAQEAPTVPLSQVREQITSQCVNILYTYRKFCATASSSGQLILPEALKLLPLYTLALTKSAGLRTDARSDTHVDERSYWLTRVASLSSSLSIPLVYPRMFAIHNLPSKEALDGAILPAVVPLSSENLDHDGIFLLEMGEDAYLYIGKHASVELVQQLFGVNSVDEVVTGQFVLPSFDNELSMRLNDIVNEIRRQRCSYLRLRLVRRGDPLEFLFFSFLVEDKSSAGLSYVEFLVHVHRQIQNKMT